ncbi:MAG: SRPBCC domain-containing protein, partial [Pseudomonadota bacterium]
MCDEAGDVLSPASMGMPEGHPETTVVIVEVEEVGGKTRMKLTHMGVPAGSGGAGGWGQAVEKMAAALAELGQRAPRAAEGRA